MNNLPLTYGATGAVVLAMIDLGMLVRAEGCPPQPDLIPGRESECIAAELGVPVALDDDVRAYVAAHRSFLVWHPAEPLGISAHKLISTGWIIGSAEVSAALATLDGVGLARAHTLAERRFAERNEDLAVWNDWIKMLRGSADSGYPIHIAAPHYDGPWIIAELLLDQAHAAEG